MIIARVNCKILKKIYQPRPNTRKGDNGRTLIIAGSARYHGSLALSAGMASKIVDLVYVGATRENFGIIKKLRGKLAEFIYAEPRNLKKIIDMSDSILVGPGLPPNLKTKKLVEKILSNTAKKIILDAGALRVVNANLLHENCAVTPHADEFKALFGKAANKKNVKQISRRFPAVILLKGKIDYICKDGRCWANATGNAGMTKGGTGDVLAGLLAGLAAKNDLLTSALIAAYANGRAGDLLKKEFGFNYSASQLPPVVARILARP